MVTTMVTMLQTRHLIPIALATGAARIGSKTEANSRTGGRDLHSKTKRISYFLGLCWFCCYTTALVTKSRARQPDSNMNSLQLRIRKGAKWTRDDTKRRKEIISIVLC